MYRAVSRILVAAALVSGGWFAWQHFRQAPATPVAEEQKTEIEDTESPETKMAHEAVTIRGPLADYVQNNKPAPERETQSAARRPRHWTILLKIHPSVPVAPSCIRRSRFGVLCTFNSKFRLTR